ncbi:MAG TPA: hypothetical protein VHB73_02260 [Alphaproteobacteria bacterium]|nr:hypothetical protein [Alphaproteobacteria bacterium]
MLAFARTDASRENISNRQKVFALAIGMAVGTSAFLNAAPAYSDSTPPASGKLLIRPAPRTPERLAIMAQKAARDARQAEHNARVSAGDSINSALMAARSAHDAEAAAARAIGNVVAAESALNKRLNKVEGDQKELGARMDRVEPRMDRAEQRLTKIENKSEWPGHLLAGLAGGALALLAAWPFLRRRPVGTPSIAPAPVATPAAPPNPATAINNKHLAALEVDPYDLPASPSVKREAPVTNHDLAGLGVDPYALAAPPSAKPRAALTDSELADMGAIPLGGPTADSYQPLSAKKQLSMERIILTPHESRYSTDMGNHIGIRPLGTETFELHAEGGETVTITPPKAGIFISRRFPFNAWVQKAASGVRQIWLFDKRAYPSISP